MATELVWLLPRHGDRRLGSSESRGRLASEPPSSADAEAGALRLRCVEEESVLVLRGCLPWPNYVNKHSVVNEELARYLGASKPKQEHPNAKAWVYLLHQVEKTLVVELTQWIALEQVCGCGGKKAYCILSVMTCSILSLLHLSPTVLRGKCPPCIL